MNTQVTLSGWTLDNPVIPASGTFGYGYEFAEWYDINILGTFSFKGTTQEARFGNPHPAHRRRARRHAQRRGPAKPRRARRHPRGIAQTQKGVP